jgi:hypothetical protein
MAEFYEFHDSVLNAMELRNKELVLRFKAYLHLHPEELGEDQWTGWTQTIEIVVTDPTVESAFLTFPVQIYDGSMKAVHIEARPEDIVGTEIPASLSVASEVEFRIFGQGYDVDEYKDMIIRGKSAAIVFKGEPKFVEKWH